ncbi:MAG: hypothetical protein ACOH5I_10685 [Oligoflexus sp.]
MSADKRWTEKAITQRKAQIKAELDQIESQDGPRGKAEWMHHKVKQLESATSPDELLSLYIYLLSSLVHHTRFQHLSDSRIKKSLKLAYAILLAQGIRESVSRLSFLHGELQYITSQVERQKGEHWSATWYQYLGEQVSRGDGPGGEAFQTLGMANRALRLGYSQMALDGLSQAYTQLADPDLKDICLSNQVQALRLSGQSEAARELIHKLRTESTLSLQLEREILWQEALLAIANDADYSRLITLTRRGKSHYTISYIVESSLWLLAAPERQWQKRVPALDLLKRRKDLEWKRHDHFFETAKAIQQCYDYEIPINTRLRKLGQNLTGLEQLLTIDKELLCWAAASRFLLRSRTESLAQLTLNAYRSHCLTLSQGQSPDVLGLFSA